MADSNLRDLGYVLTRSDELKAKHEDNFGKLEKLYGEILDEYKLKRSELKDINSKKNSEGSFGKVGQSELQDEYLDLFSYVEMLKSATENINIIRREVRSHCAKLDSIKGQCESYLKSKTILSKRDDLYLTAGIFKLAGLESLAIDRALARGSNEALFDGLATSFVSSAKDLLKESQIIDILAKKIIETKGNSSEFADDFIDYQDFS